MCNSTFKPLGSLLVLVGLLAFNANAQPTVILADPLGNPNGITVIYSTAMDPVSSVALANYRLTNAAGTVVPISGAALGTDQVTAQLQLGASLQLTTNYTLVISNVKDSGLNIIAPNPTLASFWYGGNPSGVTFSFDDGQVPLGTRLAVGPDGAGNQVNPAQGVTNAGGFGNSGCLILCDPASGQTFAQWRLTNDFSGGTTVTNFQINFKLFIGKGSGGNAGVPNAGGNGMTFHWGPGLLEQYTGGASSWGQGLDVTFRTYNSAPNTPGVNIYYGGTAGAGNNTPIATSTNLSYFQTNGVADDFSEAVDVSLSISNGILNLAYSNAVLGNVVCYSNYAIPGFAPQPMGGNNLAFTTTDGAGAHESCWLDSVDLYVNGGHVPAGAQPTGPVGIVVQPANLTTNENVYATFNVGVTGAPPVSFQWFSNGVAIPGATAAVYQTPLTLHSTMNGTHYSVAVSNSFSYAISADAILTLIQDTDGVQVASVGSLDGHSIGVQFTSFVDPVTAANPNNYRVNGAVPTAATVRTAFANYGDPVANYPAYLKTVRLTLGSTVGNGYTVNVKPGVLSRTGLPVVETNLTGNVIGMADADLLLAGTPNDPIVPGEAFSAGDRQVEIIAGGGDFLPIATTSTDRGHFAYLPRTGNFDMVAKLVWETSTMNGAKAGMLVRSFAANPDPADPGEPTVAVTVFPSPGRNTYETGARLAYASSGASWAAPGVAANGNIPAYWTTGGNWIRIRRLGPTFAGYASADGSSWQLIGLSSPDTNSFPPQEWVGLVATAANNDGRLCEADFQNWGPLTYATASVTITNNLRSNPPYVGYENGTATLTIGATVTGGVPAGELAFQWQRKGPGDSAFADILDGTGNTNTYTTPRLVLADNNTQYRVIAYVGDISTGHSVTSALATLQVLLDTTPPYMTAAAADASFQQITVTFDGPMDYNSMADISHYTLVPAAGGAAVPITSAMSPQNPDYTYSTVVLGLGSPLTPGTKYLLTVANVLDAAGNNINATTVPGGKSRIITGWLLAYGYLKYERWLGPSYPSGAGPYNSTVESLLNNPNFPNSPDVNQLITYSGYPNGDASNPSVNTFDFGAKISGFFIPPTTASYSWYVRGNDGTAIWVSSSSTPPNPSTELHKAAANTSFGAPGTSWIGSQTNLGIIGVNGNYPDTSPIPMTAGQLYAITALEQQGNGTSFLEFTCGSDGATTLGGVGLTNTPGGAYPTAGRGGAPTNSYNLTGGNIATWVNPDLSVITATGPTNITVEDRKVASFRVSATAQVSAGGTPTSVGPVLYQWYVNGTLIAGATTSSYTTPPVTYPSPVATYSVVMSVANLSFMTITNSATLTVVPDSTPPFVVAASSYAGNVLCLRFDGLLNGASVTNGTYNVNGATVTNARLASDGVTVILMLNQKLTGSTFSLAVTGVQDASGNPIAPATPVSGSLLVTQLIGAVDIGVGTNSLGAYVVKTNSQPALTNVTFDINYPGTTVMVTNGLFEIQASGRDVTGNQDGMQFVFEQRTGDFDIAVRVDGLSVADALSRAGLMLRENLTPGSRSYQILADPPSTAAADGTGNGQNKVEVIYRLAQDGATATWPNISGTAPVGSPNPPSLGSGNSATQIPGIWLRLKLVGNKLYAFTGADAVNWALVARANLASTWPKITYVGMCVSAHTNSYYTAAKLRNYGNYTLPTTPQALLLVGNNANTPAGSPNAPLQSSDARVYTNLIALGYNVTTLVNESVQAEDAEGKSVIVWSSTGNSGGTGVPSVFTNMPVPLLTWENASPRYLKMVPGSVGGTTTSSQTIINITNTSGPVASALTLGLSGPITICGSSSMMYVNKSDLAAGATIIAQPGSGTTPELRTVFFAFEKGATMTFGTAPQRRVGLFLDDGTPAQLNSTGLQLFTNAIQWAAAGAAADPPTIWTQPANLTVPVGSPATFMVTAVGPGPYTYQWARIVGVSPVDIPGAINRDYTILATALTDSGGYLVRVTSLSTGLSVTSSVATLNVVNTTPAPVSWGVSGDALNFTWPADHTGWRLEVQTNAAGIAAGPWYTWPNSANVNSVSIPIDPASPPVFYRLVYP